MEEYPEWFGGMMAVVGARSVLKAEALGEGKLSTKDIGTKKASKWSTARRQKSDMNLAGAESALREKFPGMMK